MRARHPGARAVLSRAAPLAALAAAVGLLSTHVANPGADAAKHGRGSALAAAEPTPNCPGMADAPCTVGEIRGNAYVDANRNGRYDPGTRDTRASGVPVRLADAASGAPLAETVTNANGYYSFPALPIAARYRVEVVLLPGLAATTATVVEVDASDFSTYWCCSARVDFGLVGSRMVTPAPPTAPAPPTPGPPVWTPVPPPCCVRPPGGQVHLPVLNFVGRENACASIVEVQNVGAWPTKALLVVWGEAGSCPPQCAGPLKVECSGLLAPGTAWHFMGAQMPGRAFSGIVFSAPAVEAPALAGGNADVFADLLCETLYHDVAGDCDAYRRFKKAHNEGLVFQTSDYAFDFARYPGASLSVHVLRKCPGDTNPLVHVTSSYVGLSDELLGMYDPVYGGYAYFAPLVTVGPDGRDTWLYLQNGGLECTSAEIWFHEQTDCLRPRICDIVDLAPGEARAYDARDCVAGAWSGSAWVRASQPVSVVVDAVGDDTLTTYQGPPSDLRYGYEGAPAFSAGSQVAYGPLLYSEYQGWDARLQVQNLSRTTAARAKVYFLDPSGAVVTTLSDWICAGGSQAFFLPVVAGMPGRWIGSVRVESQDWSAPGQPPVMGPNVAGVVELVKYADIGRTRALEALAYSLVPEQRAFDWQIGWGPGGLYSGVGRIGVPSLMKDRGATGLTTELAIANVVPKPGFTDFVLLVYDQNGLVGDLCHKLNESQVEYVDLDAGMAFLPTGFKGSGVISAVFWEHDVFGDGGGYVRNLVGLAAVAIERSGTVNGADVPGDESAGSEAPPIVGPYRFLGPRTVCPGGP